MSTMVAFGFMVKITPFISATYGSFSPKSLVSVIISLTAVDDWDKNNFVPIAEFGFIAV